MGSKLKADLIAKIADADDVKQTSAEMVAGIIDEITPMCQGIHLMVLGWEDLIPDILAQTSLAR